MESSKNSVTGMNGTARKIMRVCGIAIALSTLGVATASASQIITLRSGQVGGLPGLAGQPDDIVTYHPNTPPGAFISATPFTAGDFAAAASGAPAHVINPASPPWTPGISDPLARWINYDGSFFDPSGAPGPGLGLPGSVLYAVPFFISLGTITNATLTLEFAVDDHLGDAAFGGGNSDGLYINGLPTGFSGGNYAAPTVHVQNITGLVTPGLNYMYLYQRDLGVAVSGIIFSATIDVVPAPGALAMLGLGGLVATRRRR